MTATIQISGSVEIQTEKGNFQVGGWQSSPAVYFFSLRTLCHCFSLLRGSGLSRLLSRVGLPADRELQLLAHVYGRPVARIRCVGGSVRVIPTPLRFCIQSGHTPGD